MYLSCQQIYEVESNNVFDRLSMLSDLLTVCGSHLQSHLLLQKYLKTPHKYSLNIKKKKQHAIFLLKLVTVVFSKLEVISVTPLWSVCHLLKSVCSTVQLCWTVGSVDSSEKVKKCYLLQFYRKHFL